MPCDGCPFKGCDDCDAKGGETVVAQEDSARYAIDWDSKTAPGVASTNTGSLALIRDTGRRT